MWFKCMSILTILNVSAYCNPTESTTFIPKIHDVIDLLPKTKIEEIEQAHLKNDEGFRAAIFYLQSKEWRDLVDKVVNKPEFENFDKMAAKYKFNISQAISCLRNHVDSLVIDEKPLAGPNLQPFFNDIQAVVPFAEIVKALKLKLDSPEAKRFREEISSKENQKIAIAMHNLPEMVQMRKALKKMNFDVEPFIALVYTFLGWTY